VDDRRARRLLWDDVRFAKERLSRQPSADLNVPLLGFDVHLTRQELEGLATPAVEQTIRVTQGVIRWAKLPEGRLAGVFLVGGSSRMPLVGTLLHRALGEPPVVIDSPELVVAEGSLLAGAQAIPERAGPVAGPSTGLMPRIFNPDGTLVDPNTSPTSTPSSLPVGQTVVAGQLPPGFGQPPAGQVSGPGGAYSGPVAPVSGPVAPVSGPVSGGYGQPPVSGPPGYLPTPPNYGQPGPVHPVSGQPAAGPVSAPPGRPVSTGSVYASQVTPDTEATQRVGPFPPAPGRPVQPPPTPVQNIQPARPVTPPPTGYRQGQASPVYPPTGQQQPVYREPAYREPRYAEPRYAEPGYAEPAYVASSGGRSGKRILKTVFVTILLVLVPIVCGYVAYRFTSGQGLLP
jgi:hypothetical protein